MFEDTSPEYVQASFMILLSRWRATAGFSPTKGIGFRFSRPGEQKVIVFLIGLFVFGTKKGGLHCLSEKSLKGQTS